MRHIYTLTETEAKLYDAMRDVMELFKNGEATFVCPDSLEQSDFSDCWLCGDESCKFFKASKLYDEVMSDPETI